MAAELQSLLEKIQRDGIEKAVAEREEILKKATAEANALIAQAREQAAALRAEAERDAEALKKRAESAVRQAARDILLDLNAELKKRVEAITRARLDETLSADFMAEIVRTVVQSVLQNNAQVAGGGIEVMVSPAKCEELVARLAAGAGQDIVEKVSIFPNSAAGRGLKVSVNGDQVFFDFSDAALSEMVCAYAGSRVAAVISGQDN